MHFASDTVVFFFAKLGVIECLGRCAFHVPTCLAVYDYRPGASTRVLRHPASEKRSLLVSRFSFLVTPLIFLFLRATPSRNDNEARQILPPCSYLWFCLVSLFSLSRRSLLFYIFFHLSFFCFFQYNHERIETPRCLPDYTGALVLFQSEVTISDLAFARGVL